MKQGYSGSTVQRKRNLVEKLSSDQNFTESEERQKDLAALSQKIAVLPRIDHIASPYIYMEYVDGQEGLTKLNAQQAGKALRLLHEQQGYPHPCMTGLNWLIELANENLAQFNFSQQISIDVIGEHPSDALIHSEPVQLIEKNDGSIVFIDFEGIGMGSRYQDLGYIYYSAIKEDQPEVYTAFIQGYQSDSVQIDLQRVKQLAGIISLAYVGFALAYAGSAEAEKRLNLGFQLIGETGQK
jgi:aminoglycoside phosphotransferase